MFKNFGKILELLGDRLEVCVSVYNHKIQVKFDYGQNPPIIIRVMALDL